MATTNESPTYEALCWTLLMAWVAVTLTSLFAPNHRYRCRNFTCRWEGNLKVLPP